MLMNHEEGYLRSYIIFVICKQYMDYKSIDFFTFACWEVCADVP